VKILVAHFSHSPNHLQLNLQPLYRLTAGLTAVVLGAGLLVPLPVARAERPNVANLATVIKVCVNGLIFRNIFPDGTPGGPTTGITQTDAAIACRGVSSLAQARQIKLCVNGLLFTQVTEDGLPAGPRTDITTRNAAIACSICTNSLRGN
jgi:hypothetical protein